MKNGAEGERPVALSGKLATMLEDYLAHTRHDVTEEYGRELFFTTSRGRMHREHAVVLR